jgi:CBS-domain-containing membrane protein
MVKLPAEFLACLIGPGILYFRSFIRIVDLPVRVGASLIAVIASWTGVSTAVLVVRVGLSDGSAVAMLVAVYLLGATAFLVLRADPAKNSPLE